jgi:two-component system NarL family sensor kinase
MRVPSPVPSGVPSTKDRGPGTPGRCDGDTSCVTSSPALTSAPATTRSAGRRVRGLPVALGVGSVLLVAVAAYVDLLVSAAEREAASTGFGSLTALTGAVVAAAAAVILNGRPGHLVGVVLAALGVVWTLDGVLEAWGAYALAHDLPGADFAFWFVWRLGSALLTGLVALLLVYPTGRLMPGRWGRVAAGVLVAAATLPVGLVLAPDSVVVTGDYDLPGVRTDLLAIPVPDTVAVVYLTLSRLLTMLALAVAVGLLVVRHRRADEVERTQLRWLLWAGVMVVLTVVVSLAVSMGGLLTTVLLTAAVVTIAVSVTIGVLRPGLGDVDTLVAGTLTNAGVALVVIGFDLAVLALGGRLLGDRLDQRDVTVLVLVAAVLLYGPLRTGLGSGVRRLLFGRRGDRYDVVSGLAARLEQATSVEEQLPALAGAVASTFKVPYVEVEVFTSDGGALSASHGRPTAETHTTDIAYHGERVGRLVLPLVGVRAMLSRRDQGLLVDLVRQAAIAIRTRLLADELQESRERLVLGREDDRRRIRRDLHDGLGPVLGGVALRLDAAGNAVTADPDRARELVRVARTEVREALDDVRRLVHDLRPPALDDLGLEAALQQQAERVRSELDVTVAAAGLGGLPAAVEVAAYRIVSESLTNVVRHARATRADVTVRRDGNAVTVEVRDDGRGIGEDVTAGVGLLSLRERAEELGGRCEVSCPTGGGTRVWAWLPLGGVHGAEER